MFTHFTTISTPNFAMIETVIILTVLLYLYIGYSQHQKSGKLIAKKRLRRMPGPPSLPIIGSFPFCAHVIGYYKWIWMTNYEFLKRMCNAYGSTFAGGLGVHYCVLTEDYEVARHIMNSDEWANRYSDHPMFYERSFNKPIGLAMANGENWKEIRRFTARTLRKYGFGKGNTMESSIWVELDEVMGIFKNLVDDSSYDGVKGRGIVDMHLIFNVSVLNIVWTLMAGARFSRDDAKLHKLLVMVDEVSKSAPQGVSMVFAFPFLRYIPRLTEHDMILKLHRVTQNLFREIMEEKRKKSLFMENPQDLIDEFLREIELRKKYPEPNYYTDEQCIMTCTDLFFTGSDTTSTTIEFAILYMILHPHVQEKVQEEIDRVIGIERLPSLEDRANMPYTEATMNEVLRFSSILPLTVRSPLEDNDINGYFVPKGTITGINLHAINFSDKLWDNPNEFDPGRFLDANNNIVNAHKIMPFGFGKRGCMGEQTARATFFVFFISLLQKYKFEPSPLHQPPTDEPISGFTQYPKPYHSLVSLRT